LGVISQRKRIIEETDKVELDNEDEDEEGPESDARPGSWRNPSGEAIAKFTDFCKIDHELGVFSALKRTQQSRIKMRLRRTPQRTTPTSS
jgi:hypothetical protein